MCMSVYKTINLLNPVTGIAIEWMNVEDPIRMLFVPGLGNTNDFVFQTLNDICRRRSRAGHASFIIVVLIKNTWKLITIV